MEISYASLSSMLNIELEFEGLLNNFSQKSGFASLS